MPGPGAYNTAGSPSAPAYTMGARPVEVPKPGPGPGSYNVRDPQEAPAFTFASRPIEGESCCLAAMEGMSLQCHISNGIFAAPACLLTCCLACCWFACVHCAVHRA